MNTTLKKIIKGTLAIFAIKLVILAGLFVFQSCESESLDSDASKTAKSNFLSTLSNSREELMHIPMLFNKKPDHNVASMRSDSLYQESTTICLYTLPNSEDDAPEINDDPTLGDLIEIDDTELDIVDSNDGENINDTPEGELIGCFEIPNEPTEESLEPSIVQAKNYLYSLGLTDDEIAEELNGEAEANLVLTVMVLIAAESNDSSDMSLNLSGLFGNTLYAQDNAEIVEADWYDCLLRSVGIDAVIELVNGKVTKKIAKKAIRKVVSRTLGWVGAAIAIYEFGDCMGWY